MSDNGSNNAINLESLFNTYLSDKQFNFSNPFGDFSKFNVSGDKNKYNQSFFFLPNKFQEHCKEFICFRFSR